MKVRHVHVRFAAQENIQGSALITDIVDGAGAGETALLFSTNAKLPCGGNGRLYGSVRKRPILRLTLVRSVEQRAGLWLLLVQSRHCKQSSAMFDMACARVSSIESEPTTDESDNS